MDPEETPKKSKKKLILMIVGGVFVAFVAKTFLLGGSAPEDDAVTTTTIVAVEGAIVESEQMTVNLADADARYARIKFAVVLPVGGDSAAVGERFPILKDAVLGVISAFTADQLLGPDGLDDLRSQFTEKAEEVWPDGEVMRVLVTEVLVQ